MAAGLMWSFDEGLVDSLGPYKVLHINDRGLGLSAVVVVDNVSCGPAIGGCRMATSVSVVECFRLARAMTFKNAAAGLPHGGAKSVIAADPKMPITKKEDLIRAFAHAIAPVIEYIPGPDMGTDERCMGWVHDEMGRAVGLPAEVGGIPLDEIGATGFGLGVCAEVAQDFAGISLGEARFVMQGFGAVGRHGSRFLTERGATLVAVSDSKGAVLAPNGIDLVALSEHKAETGSVAGCPGTRAISPAELVGVDCELWVPAARPDAITAANAERLRARLVVPGANIAVAAEAEAGLAERGVLVMPDFIANAGGVICAAVEYRGGTATEAFATIEELARTNTQAVLESSRSNNELPRAAAQSLAKQRVDRAMSVRRFARR